VGNHVDAGRCDENIHRPFVSAQRENYYPCRKLIGDQQDHEYSSTTSLRLSFNRMTYYIETQALQYALSHNCHDYAVESRCSAALPGWSDDLDSWSARPSLFGSKAVVNNKKRSMLATGVQAGSGAG
jgi:hypothetical protein